MDKITDNPSGSSIVVVLKVYTASPRRAFLYLSIP